MGLDELLIVTSDVASKALPIAGLVVLVLLAVFVKRLLDVLKNANDAILSVKKTVDTANTELETLKKPLHTISEISETVDSVHEASKHAIRSSMVVLVDNFSLIKDWILNYLGKGKEDLTQDVQTNVQEAEDHE